MPENSPILEAKNLWKVFPVHPEPVTAVQNINFSLAKGETVSIVGQSGSGKTTFARMLLKLESPTEGEILFNGISNIPKKEYWKHVQAIFQDPFSSFNQFFTIKQQLFSSNKMRKEPLNKSSWEEAYKEALQAVNLDWEKLEGKYPFELSGGQMQRLLIARIFLIEPEVVLADEPTSMVDACSRGSILKYLMKLKEEKGTSLIFITHDLGLAYHVSDRVAIMNKGSFVEMGDPEKILTLPDHPYTEKLLEDIPTLEKKWLEHSLPDIEKKFKNFERTPENTALKM